MPDANAKVLARFDEHLASRPATTREAYRRDVGALAELAGERPLVSLKRPELARFLATLHGRGLSGRSLARMLSSWRAFYRLLLDHDRSLAEDPTAGLKPPKSPRRLPSALSPDEAGQLVEIVADDPLSLRDRAILELAYSSGLRLSELTGLDVARVDLDGGEARVVGKGAKERIVPVGRAALDALRAWLIARKTLAAPGESALFVARTGGRISARAIEKRLADWAVSRGSRATCTRTCCATRSRRTCCSRRGTCAPCRRCSATRRSRRRRSTRISTSRRSRRSTTPRTRARRRRPVSRPGRTTPGK
jgi:integrase/recombinase XerC